MKTTRAISLLFAVLLTAGCATVTTERISESPDKLLFSIRKTEGAFSGVEKKDTGYFFYIAEEKTPLETQFLITGSTLRRGEGTDIFGGGTSFSQEIFQQLDRIGFEPFDFDAEVKRVDALLAEEARRTGIQINPPFTFDGAEYEIRLIYGGVDFTLKKWNPWVTIDFYATYSPKIAKLKAVIDCFALSYGRTKFAL